MPHHAISDDESLGLSPLVLRRGSSRDGSRSKNIGSAIETPKSPIRGLRTSVVAGFQFLQHDGSGLVNEEASEKEPLQRMQRGRERRSIIDDEGAGRRRRSLVLVERADSGSLALQHLDSTKRALDASVRHATSALQHNPSLRQRVVSAGDVRIKAMDPPAQLEPATARVWPAISRRSRTALVHPTDDPM